MFSRRQFLRRIGAATLVAALDPGRGLAHGRLCEKENPMQPIQTVAGPVAPGELGVTLIHEHVMCDFVGADKTGPHRWKRDEVVEVMLPHLNALREAGGRTFVDCSPKYLGRDAALLKRLAEESGLHIITNTGLYKEPYLPDYALHGTAESLADDWTREAEEGIEGTGIRPGFIKIAANEGPLNAIQQKIVRAAALTHLRTGLTIAAHTTEGRTALQELDVLERKGVAAAAFIWVHADAGTESEVRLEAARRGAWIELDAVDPDSPERHVTMIQELLEAGMADQVLISQDRGWYSVGEPRGGTPRPYEKLLTDFVPALEKAGISRSTIDKLLQDNPRRALGPRVRTVSA
jgi:phosphotriesterase-related protein